MTDVPEKLQKEPQTEEDAKNLLKLLETEHRKASISDETYNELKSSLKEKLKYLENTITQEDIEKTKNAGPLQVVEEPEEEAGEEEKKDGGLLGKIMHRGDKKKGKKPDSGEDPDGAEESAAKIPDAGTASPDSSEDVAKLGVELEKMKVMMDASREQKKVSDDSLRTAFESIGELRSMVMQNDANMSDISAKFERIEDDVSEVRPKKIEKKFSETQDRLNKMELSLEKIQTKTNDMAERINKVHELLKSMGGVENLIKVNENVQKKLDDVKEAMRYAERLASKTEKMFLEIKTGLDDMLVYKAKQESVDEGIKDLTKSMDALETKFEFYATTKDMGKLNNDIMLLQRQIDNINNVVPVLQSNVPEPIIMLRRQRDDIKIFLNSLETQFKSGKIKLRDYESIKKKNIAKLKSLEKALEREWKSVEEMFRRKPEDEETDESAETVESPSEPEDTDKEETETPETLEVEKDEEADKPAATETPEEDAEEDKAEEEEETSAGKTSDKPQEIPAEETEQEPEKQVSEEPAREEDEEHTVPSPEENEMSPGKGQKKPELPEETQENPPESEKKEAENGKKHAKSTSGFLNKLRGALEHATEKVDKAKEAISKEETEQKGISEESAKNTTGAETDKPPPDERPEKDRATLTGGAGPGKTAKESVGQEKKTSKRRGDEEPNT